MLTSVAISAGIVSFLPANRKDFISELKYLSKKNKKKEIKSLIIELGGVEYTNQKIKELSDSAIKDLDIFPHSDVKEALISAINFNTERRH